MRGPSPISQYGLNTLALKLALLFDIARAALRALALFETNVYYVVPFKHAGAKAGVIIRYIAQAALRALALFRTDGFHGACAAFLAALPLTRGEYALGSFSYLFALNAMLSLRIVSAEELGE